MGSSVTVSMIYRRAPEAIEWICRVFGFKKHAVYPGEDHTIAHSELTLDGGMVMVASWVEGHAYNQVIRMPDQIGGAETVTVNLTVKDADEAYRRVKAEGGEIVFDIEDKDYGGRGFTCRDPEGHIWNVGTYDPWAKN